MASVERSTPSVTHVEDLDDLVRVEEAAAYLRIGRGMTYAMVKRGEIPSVKFGRLVRIPRSWLAAQAGREELT